MRKHFSNLIGVVAIFIGLLVSPIYIRHLWKIHMLVSELSWIPMVMSLLAALRAARRRSWTAATLSFIGGALCARPFFQMRDTVDRMEVSMRHGLGEDYMAAIPPAVIPRLSWASWTVAAALGSRYLTPRTSATRNITYSVTESRPLKLDIYQPVTNPPVGELYPAIIAMHGGSWNKGDKGAYFGAHHRYLANQGYIVFDIQYRLAHEAHWPAARDDVLSAIRWVKANAGKYRVDPDRIALLGRSAGGHLGLSAAYLDNEATSVAAVVAFYAPTDLRMWHPFRDSTVDRFIGGSTATHRQAYHDSAPVEFVRDNLPPTLLIQGYQDYTVNYGHTENLANRLETTNTPTVVLRVNWSRHGFDFPMMGAGSQLVQYNLDRFLAWSLYGR